MVYQPEWDLRAMMLRQLEQIPYIRDLVKRLRRNPYLRNVCGYGERAPCEAHSRARSWDGRFIEQS